MSEIRIGYQVDFANHCPFLMKHPPERRVGMFFESENEAIIASEIPCSNGGLPGMDKRTDSGFLVPVNADRVVAYCSGCPSFPGGFEKRLE